MTDSCLLAPSFVSSYTHPATDTLPPGVAMFPWSYCTRLELTCLFLVYCLTIIALRLTIELIYITGIYYAVVAYDLMINMLHHGCFFKCVYDHVLFG